MAEAPQRGRKKVKITRRRRGKTVPENGSSASAGKPKAPAEASPEPAQKAKEAHPPEAWGDWEQIADRAAKKLRELAEEAKSGKTAESAKRMAVDVSEGLESAFEKIRDQARNLMAKGQHTRVRLKFRGRQLVELPIAVVAAAEVASFAWFGPLRVVIGHVVGKAMLEVEFVSNGDTWVQLGKTLLADGELEKAETEFDKALAMDRKHAGALLGKGIVHKLRGDRAGARAWFEKAEDADPRSEAGREARRHLDNL